jgi:hypothetical protein
MVQNAVQNVHPSPALCDMLKNILCDGNRRLHCAICGSNKIFPLLITAILPFYRQSSTQNLPSKSGTAKKKIQTAAA